MLRRKKKCSFAMLAGAGAAVVAVLSIGGYILHKKVLKYRLRELARRQAMNLAMFDLNNGGGMYDDDDCDYDDIYEYDLKMEGDDK